MVAIIIWRYGDGELQGRLAACHRIGIFALLDSAGHILTLVCQSQPVSYRPSASEFSSGGWGGGDGQEQPVRIQFCV